MDKRGVKKRHKRKMGNTCVYSGKALGSKDAVLIEYARDYLKSLGYLVTKKPIMLFLFSFLMIFSLSMTSGALYENYSSGYDANLHIFGTTNVVGQTFTVGAVGLNESFDLTSIKVRAFKVGTPGNFNVTLHLTNTTGYPNATIVSSGSTNAEDFTTNTDGLWYEIEMSDYTLNPGVKYGLMFKTTAGTGTGDDVQLKIDYTSATYPGGNVVYSATGGSTWTQDATYDSMFEIYGDGGCIPNLTNTTWSNYINSSCNTSNLYFASKYLTQYDANFCGGSNITIWGNSTVSCDYCTPSMQNVTLQDWFDVTSCINDSKTQNSTIEEFDINLCDEIGNVTYYLQRSTDCISSNVAMFHVDLESKTTVVMIVLTFLAAFALLIMGIFIFSGSLFIVLGFILYFSEFNIILSIITIVGGVLVLFLSER